LRKKVEGYNSHTDTSKKGSHLDEKITTLSKWGGEKKKKNLGRKREPGKEKKTPKQNLVRERPPKKRNQYSGSSQDRQQREESILHTHLTVK